MAIDYAEKHNETVQRWEWLGIAAGGRRRYSSRGHGWWRKAGSLLNDMSDHETEQNPYKIVHKNA